MATHCFRTGEDETGERLDIVLARRLPELSRSRATALVRSGCVRIGRRVANKPAERLRGGETVEVAIPPPEPSAARGEDIPVTVLYEDDDLLVVDKPAGLVVHPAQGHRGGTLVNALLGRAAALAPAEDPLRPGIVHRLDKDTSGCLVVAKTVRAREGLMAQFHAREVGKTYWAVVRGHPPGEGSIGLAIGRDPRARKRMSVHALRGKPASTRWRVLETYPGASLLEVSIATGRTHQIRVHLASLGHPVLGDPVYGPARRRPGPGVPARQALHAAELRFRHPSSGRAMAVRAPLPEDLERLLGELRKAARTRARA